MSNYTAKDLESLRRQAQEIEKVLAARQTAMQQSYAAQKETLAQQREKELRQAYISQQQALAQLPGQLAQAGLNGGPAESSLVQLNRSYGAGRADINSRYARENAALQTRQDAEAAELAEQEAKNRIDYIGAESAIQSVLAAQAQKERQQAEQQNTWAARIAALQTEIDSLKKQTQAPAQSTAKSAGKALQHSSLVGHAALVR